jgi:hypothetical protein
MELIFHGRIRAGFVGYVTGVATHIEGGMTAALFRNVEAGLMATEAEVFFLISGGGFQELILVVAGVWIVASKAVANSGRMDRSLDVGCFLVSMAGDAEVGRGSGDEYNPRDIFIDSYLMAGQASGGHGGMYSLAFGFVLMTFKAFCGVGFGIKGHGMNGSVGARGYQGEEHYSKPEMARGFAESWSSGRFVKPDAMHDHSHTAMGEVSGAEVGPAPERGQLLQGKLEIGIGSCDGDLDHRDVMPGLNRRRGATVDWQERDVVGEQPGCSARGYMWKTEPWLPRRH